MELYNVFRFARKTQNIKQSYLAEKAGIAQPSLANYESGHSTLSERTLMVLAPIININPKYIKGESANPFFSKELIRMYFPENLISGMDDAPLEFIVRANSALEIVFLIATSKVKAFDRARSKTIIGQMTLAVLVRDQVDNVFILRRKRRGAYLVGESDIQAKLSKIVEEENNDVVFRSKRITHDLSEKIRDWTVEKRDVEDIFSRTHKMEINSAEKEMIEKIRAQGVDPRTVSPTSEEGKAK